MAVIYSKACGGLHLLLRVYGSAIPRTLLASILSTALAALLFYVPGKEYFQGWGPWPAYFLCTQLSSQLLRHSPGPFLVCDAERRPTGASAPPVPLPHPCSLWRHPYPYQAGCRQWPLSLRL